MSKYEVCRDPPDYTLRLVPIYEYTGHLTRRAPVHLLSSSVHSSLWLEATAAGARLPVYFLLCSCRVGKLSAPTDWLQVLHYSRLLFRLATATLCYNIGVPLWMILDS